MSPTVTATAFGDAAVLVVGLARDAVRLLAATVRDAGRPGVRGAVEGMASVLVVVDPDTLAVDDAVAWITSLGATGVTHGAPRTVVVPTVFGGPDTDEVCRLGRVTPDELVELLCGADLTAAVLGFSPGFAYLDGLPPPLAGVPRRARPRPAVPAGSVAIAAGFAAVYPQVTPGGWQILGHTTFRLFDPSRPPYAVLEPGDRVRFVPAAADVERAGGDGGEDGDPARGEHATGPGGGAGPVREGSGEVPRAPLRVGPRRPADLVVERPGMLSMVQDGGRGALAHLGVPAAGPADDLAHALANRLVGNPADMPAVEVTAAGPTLRAGRDLFVAVVGAEPDVLVDGREVGHSHVVPVAGGQRLTVGAVRGGLRTYVAVAGGVLVPPVLESCSTDVLTWLGPGPLVAGDELAVGPPAASPAGHLSPGVLAAWRDARGAGHARAARGAASYRWTLRVLPGPHARWLEGGIGALVARAYTVGPTSDRVGVRLEPAGAPLERRAGEVASQGMVFGAVQVPPDGEPIVLGPDHATLGGYPVAAVVAVADRWMLGQCRPGDTVVFAETDLTGAAAARAAARALVAGGVMGRYPLAPLR